MIILLFLIVKQWFQWFSSFYIWFNHSLLIFYSRNRNFFKLTKLSTCVWNSHTFVCILYKPFLQCYKHCWYTTVSKSVFFPRCSKFQCGFSVSLFSISCHHFWLPNKRVPGRILKSWFSTLSALIPLHCLDKEYP